MVRDESTHNQVRSGPAVAAAGESDERLAARASTDPAAFAELYERYVARIDQYCRWRLRDRDLAQDATSQIFLKALEGLRRRRIDNVASWLFTIAHNEVVDRYRRQHQTTAFDSYREVASSGQSVEDLAILASSSADLHRLLPLLSPDQQDVIELRLAGLTSTEIQEVLGRSKSWVATTHHRALRRLRGLLDPVREEVRP